MPPSGSHLMRTTNGAQAHLQLRLYLWAPEKRARIVSRLGERTVRIRKVVGSIPIRSTKMEIAAVKTAAISRLTTERVLF